VPRRLPSPRRSTPESVPDHPTAQKPRPADTPQRTPVPPSMGHAVDAAAVYQLHAFANDMAENERCYTRDHAATTTQTFGFDISMRRLTADGTWSYQAEWNDAVKRGFPTRALSGYDGTAKTHAFAAVWRK
jgi:hypothetical protein